MQVEFSSVTAQKHARLENICIYTGRKHDSSKQQNGKTASFMFGQVVDAMVQEWYQVTKRTQIQSRRNFEIDDDMSFT
jgi:hypothetical protein